MQLVKAAQLGLKPAPNSQDLEWAAFGAPPAASAALPASQVGGACSAAWLTQGWAANLGFQRSTQGWAARVHPKTPWYTHLPERPALPLPYPATTRRILTPSLAPLTSLSFCPQNKTKYQDSQQQRKRQSGAAPAGEGGGGNGHAAKTETCQSPRAAAASAAALPRAVVHQQAQQAQQARHQPPPTPATA